MNKTSKQSLKHYKDFVDSFLKINTDIYTSWVRDGYPKTQENEKTNHLLSELSSKQKESLTNMLQEAKKSGIHDALVVLQKKIDHDNFKLTKDHKEIKLDPFGSEIYYDWICRLEGDAWPDE